MNKHTCFFMCILSLGSATSLNATAATDMSFDYNSHTLTDAVKPIRITNNAIHVDNAPKKVEPPKVKPLTWMGCVMANKRNTPAQIRCWEQNKKYWKDGTGGGQIKDEYL